MRKRPERAFIRGEFEVQGHEASIEGPGKEAPNAPMAEVKHPRRVESSRGGWGGPSTSKTVGLEVKLRVRNVGEGEEHPALGEDVFEVLADDIGAVRQDNTHIYTDGLNEIKNVWFSIPAEGVG